jgi:hypothetical protein
VVSWLRRREERRGIGLDGCKAVAGVGRLGNWRFIFDSSEGIGVSGRELFDARRCGRYGSLGCEREGEKYQ